MEDINKLFWDADVQEMKRGYIWNEEVGGYTCLICGKTYEEGIVYPQGELLFTAEKALKDHISKEHGSVFGYLMELNKRYTGLTDTQKKILGYFYKGFSDKEIIKIQGGGSTSTIRNHRFKFNEKQKQSKVFLALMGLLDEKNSRELKYVGDNNSQENKDEFVSLHKGVTMVDERYAITEKDKEKTIKNYFEDGKFKVFPSKEKKKIIILQHIIKDFDANRKYIEKEVNEIIKRRHDDFVTIRRYFIQYGFMDRTKDCSEYWVKMG